MKELRKKLIEWLFRVTQHFYTTYFKNTTPWGITKAELLNYPDESFGKHLGEFLHRHNFELIPKVERHDCYHVLCNYTTNVEDEIALQCLCFGNGKRSIYLFGVLIIGISILPDYHKYYYKSFKIGKSLHTFHNLDYKHLLHESLSDLQRRIFPRNIIQTIIQ